MESKYDCSALSTEQLREVCVIGLTRGELWLPCVRTDVIDGQHYWRDAEDQAPAKHGPFGSERAALLDAIETEGVENPAAWGIVEADKGQLPENSKLSYVELLATGPLGNDVVGQAMLCLASGRVFDVQPAGQALAEEVEQATELRQPSTGQTAAVTLEGPGQFRLLNVADLARFDGVDAPRKMPERLLNRAELEDLGFEIYGRMDCWFWQYSKDGATYVGGSSQMPYELKSEAEAVRSANQQWHRLNAENVADRKLGALVDQPAGVAQPSGASPYLDYVQGLPLQDALWWFIENASDDLEGRTEIFFALRERMRAQGQEATLAGPGALAGSSASGLHAPVARTLMVSIPIKTDMAATPEELATVVENLIGVGVLDAHSTLEDKGVDHQAAQVATGIDFGPIQVVGTTAAKRLESIGADPSPGM